MMEFKTRAWSNNCWIGEGMVYDYQDTIYVEIFGFNSPELPVMQFTGLKDKNGVFYCQDDIVKYKNKLYRLIKGNYQFELAGFNESGQDDPCDFFSEDAFQKGEIVGNIYENPELLNL